MVKTELRCSQFTQSAVSSGVDQQQRPLLGRTRPFAVIDRRWRSLAEALQVRPMMMVMMMVMTMMMVTVMKVIRCVCVSTPLMFAQIELN